MLEGVSKNIFISQELKYFDITNIFFDAPLKESDINNIKEIMFSINNITQIYFTEDIDIETIELVKYLLEISPTMQDSNVEKYILTTKIDIDKLLNINFMNSSTWYLSILDKNKEEKILNIDSFRLMNSSLNKIIEKLDLSNYSIIERVGLIYDYCKKITIDDEINDLNIVLSSSKSSKNTIVLLMQLLLRHIGINSYIGKAINDEQENNILIADIKDEKYNIDGIYLFDVLSDYLSKEDVPVLNKINYNYFAINVCDYSKTVFNDKLLGILNCMSHDEEYDYEKLENVSKKDMKYFELSFNSDIQSIHKRIENTKEIDDEIKLKIIDSINKDDLKDIINENYLSRKDKILNYGILN